MGIKEYSYIKLVNKKIRELCEQKSFIFRFLSPKLLLHRSVKEEDLLECGFYLSNLDTGIYFCKYDFGKEFRLVVLGFGFYIWWNPDLKVL